MEIARSLIPGPFSRCRMLVLQRGNSPFKTNKRQARRDNMKTYKIQATEINQWFKEVKAKTEKDALKKINEYWSGDENNFSFENFENGKTETNFKIIDIQAREQKR